MYYNNVGPIHPGMRSLRSPAFPLPRAPRARSRKSEQGRRLDDHPSDFILNALHVARSLDAAYMNTSLNWGPSPGWLGPEEEIAVFAEREIPEDQVFPAVVPD